MKKAFKIISLGIVVSILTGWIAACSNETMMYDESLEDPLTRSEFCEKDTTLRLCFDDEQQLKSIIAAGDEESDFMTRGSLPVTVVPSNFVSLVSPIPGNAEGSTYYESLGYDSLVPNINFAKLLNIQGEMEVKDRIVKITPKGTYIVAKKYENDFRSWLANNTKHTITTPGESITLANGMIQFISTFGETPGDYSLVSEGNYTDMPEDDTDGSSEAQNISVQTRSSTSEPKFDDFAVFSADKKTILGKLIQNIIGSTKAHTLNYNSKKRLKGSFYFYNYGVYSEIGVKGWTDKKNWFGWSKTASTELRVGWRNVVLDVPMTDDLKNTISGKTLYMAPQPIKMGSERVQAATLVADNLPPTLWENIARKGAKAVIEFIKSRYDASKTKDIDKSQAFIIATPSELKFVAADEDVIKYNDKSYCHTFSEEFMKINIGWSNTDGFSFNNLNGNNIDNLGPIVKFIVDLFTQKHTTLVSGEVYVCAFLGNEWRGMKIIKSANK